MSADPNDLTRRPGHELAAGLRSGAFSAREVTDAHLAAAERDNHGLHAWLTIDTTTARLQADAGPSVPR